MKNIHDDWQRLPGDFELDIAAGKVRVFDEETGRFRAYRLTTVHKQLIQKAYEDGRKRPSAV